MRLLATLVFLLLGGCGYQFGGASLPGDVRVVHIAQPRNLTLEPLLETHLGRPLAAQLGKQPHIRLANTPEGAEAVLATEVVDYQVEPISYSVADRISAFQATLVVRFFLKRQPGGEVLWQDEVRRQGNYSAATDKNLQEDLESAQQQVLADDIATDMVQHLITRF